MPQQDLKNNIAVVHLGNLTLSGTTAAESDWVDTRGYDTCTFIPISNTVTDAGTASGFSFTVEDSDTTVDGDAVAVADAELIGLESALTVTSDSADDSVSGLIGYVGDARYVRLSAVGTTNTDADVSVIAILSQGHLMPNMAGVQAAVAAT